MVTGKNVLIVDDEKHMRDLCQELFEEEGQKVKTASCAEEAMAAFEEGGLDLIVLDIKLSNLESGLDVLGDIRAQDQDVPVILYTAYDSFQHDIKSIAADYYVVKSVDTTELMEKGMDALRKKPLIYGDAKSIKLLEGMDDRRRRNLGRVSYRECSDLPYAVLEDLKAGKTIDVAVATVGKSAPRIVDFHYAAREIDPHFMTVLSTKKGSVMNAEAPGIIHADPNHANGAYIQKAIINALKQREIDMDLEYRKIGNNGFTDFRF